MEDEIRAEQEMARLQSLHDTVERLRAQLKTIQIEDDSGRTARAFAKPNEDSQNRVA